MREPRGAHPHCKGNSEEEEEEGAAIVQLLLCISDEISRAGACLARVADDDCIATELGHLSESGSELNTVEEVVFGRNNDDSCRAPFLGSVEDVLKIEEEIDRCGHIVVEHEDHLRILILVEEVVDLVDDAEAGFHVFEPYDVAVVKGSDVHDRCKWEVVEIAHDGFLSVGRFLLFVIISNTNCLSILFYEIVKMV